MIPLHFDFLFMFEADTIAWHAIVCIHLKASIPWNWIASLEKEGSPHLCLFTDRNKHVPFPYGL